MKVSDICKTLRSIMKNKKGERRKEKQWTLNP